MRLSGPALRLTVFVDETDQWRRRPLFTEIVHRAHAAGMAGATVLRGIEGFGASGRVHAARLLRPTGDLPVAIIIVDAEQRVRDFLPQLDELVEEGLVILDKAEVHRYIGERARTPRRPRWRRPSGTQSPP